MQQRDVTKKMIMNHLVGANNKHGCRSRGVDKSPTPRIWSGGLSPKILS